MKFYMKIIWLCVYLLYMCRLPGPLVGPNRLFFLEIQCNDSIPTAPTAYYCSYPKKTMRQWGLEKSRRCLTSLWYTQGQTEWWVKIPVKCVSLLEMSLTLKNSEIMRGGAIMLGSVERVDTYASWQWTFIWNSLTMQWFATNVWVLCPRRKNKDEHWAGAKDCHCLQLKKVTRNFYKQLQNFKLDKKVIQENS